MVEKHGWQLFCLHPEDVLTKVVKEFYAHLASLDNAFIYVHSALVLFDEYSINTQYDLLESLNEHFQLVNTITTKGLNQVLEDLCGYVKRKDKAIKKSPQKNFTRPMLTFLTFPKELLLNLKDKDEDEVEATVTDTTTYPVTVKKMNKETEGEEEKIEWGTLNQIRNEIT
ncbi:hypothetical protein J1N35_033811 [Gossypium stocksii]|uniref:Uncharacterized protein n=1 Tax=Gossypium stocksii TaxID=47602 RepID=A0A9D3ZNQ3_9ROSI|nr:hypothetical protein J1N35_033811 [Gossypium stocksii]